ncbi:cbb3-type cytochrome oxidase assembly protein CcoS [Porticoccus sp.]
MASLYLLIPVSLIFCALAIWIFFWAVNNGQYDDLEGEADRILFEEDDDLSSKSGQQTEPSAIDHSEHKDT